MNELKLIFINLDGTLINGQQHDLYWLEKIRKLNPELKERNIYLTIATERPAPYAESILQAINGEVPAVCENGSIVYTPNSDKITVNNLVPKKFEKTINKIESLLEKKLTGEYNIKPGREASISLTPVNVKTPDGLKKLLKGFDVDVIYSKKSIDIQARAVTKMNGIELILKKLNVKIENTAGIGSSMNDYKMLEKIGYPCCPRNAEKRIKELIELRKGYISKNDCTEGVYYCIKKYSFIKA